MESKEVVLIVLAVLVGVIAVFGLVFHSDVTQTIQVILLALFGHHLTNDKNNNGIPDEEETTSPTPEKIPDSVKIVPASYTPPAKPNVRVKTTRYGKGVKAGGWDHYEDSGTDAGMGCFGNHLTNQACALTVSAQRALGAIKYDHILLTWNDGRTRTVRFEDRAPETDARVDIYLPLADDPSIPQYGYAQVVTSDDIHTV